MCGVARAVLSVACHIHCPAVQFLVNTVQKSHCATPLFSSLSVTCSFSSFKVNWQGVCLSKIPILGCQCSCKMDCVFVFVSFWVLVWMGCYVVSMFGLSWQATLHVCVWLSDFIEVLSVWLHFSESSCYIYIFIFISIIRIFGRLFAILGPYNI